MDESTSASEQADGSEDHNLLAPEVTQDLDGDTARVSVVGELTEAARRPLVRAMTDLLLTVPTLRRTELHLAGVSFMSSAGMSVLVQLERMSKPRGVELVLVEPPVAVSRPLQMTGLWHRFAVVESPAGAENEAVDGPVHP